MKPEKVEEELKYLARHFRVRKPKWKIVGKSPRTYYAVAKKSSLPYVKIVERVKVKGHVHTNPLEIIFHGPPTKSTLMHEFIHCLEHIWGRRDETRLFKRKNCPICRGIVFHSFREIKAYQKKFGP